MGNLTPGAVVQKDRIIIVHGIFLELPVPVSVS